jgi:hypothetical protein
MNQIIKICIGIALIILSISCSNNKRKDRTLNELFPVPRIREDRAVQVTKNELLLLIKKGSEKAETKAVKDFTDDEHILMIMLLNSYALYDYQDDKQLNSAYNSLAESISIVTYTRQAGDHLEWIPNPGMGMFFCDLNAHFGGSMQTGWSFFKLTEN